MPRPPLLRCHRSWARLIPSLNCPRLRAMISLQQILASRVRVLAAIIACVLLSGTGLHVSAQPSFNRLVHIVVTMPDNRLITGLEQRNFELSENGSPRAITYFSTNSP